VRTPVDTIPSNSKTGRDKTLGGSNPPLSASQVNICSAFSVDPHNGMKLLRGLTPPAVLLSYPDIFGS